MSTQTDARPTVRYTLACPAWCTVDHHLSTDSTLHERAFAAPALDDAEPTVMLSQSDAVSGGEPAAITVYLPRDMLTAAEALDMGKALASAGDLLQRSAAVAGRRVEVVQVLPDLVAMRDAQGGLRIVGSDVVPGITPGTGRARAVLMVTRRDGLVLYLLAASREDLLAAAERAVEDPSSAAWEWVQGEWSACLAEALTAAVAGAGVEA